MNLKKYFCYALIALSFSGLLFVSWLRWGNLIVDTFNDPWIAYKISEGGVLYKDIHYMFGPLPPYFIAFLYKMFGVNLFCLVFTGVALALAATLFIYRLSRLFLGRAFSTLVTLNFLFVFAFGCYCYSGLFNFILPYNFASTFFATFSLSALYFFIKFVKKERYGYLLCWVISMYLAFLSRMETSFAIWAVFAFLHVTHAHKKKGLIAAEALSPLLLALLSYLVFLRSNGALDGFRESIISTFSFKGRGLWEFYISGFNNLFANLSVVAGSFMLQLAAVFCIYAASAMLFFLFKRVAKTIPDMALYSIAGFMSLWITSLLLQFMHFFRQYSLSPFLLFAGITVYLFRLFYGVEEDRKKWLSRLTLFLVSFVLIARILLRVSPNFYGFYLFLPGLIAYYIFFIELCPSFFRRLIPVNDKIKSYYLVSLSVFFVLPALFFTVQSYHVYKQKNFTTVTEKGTMRSFNDRRTVRFWETIRFLKKNTSEDALVVVLPEGVGINFFSSRNNPSRFFQFIPTLVGKIGGDKIIHDLEAHDIDYMIILQRYTHEHGCPSFGMHYGKKIYSWILENYRPIKLIGPRPFTTNEFGVAIFKKI